ncbi:hypothetical protein MPDQ_007603 [Monascus purpureus]|uniref:BTB domain-containing protein n=1 Tax=Monascus purpureus TaxID=5098 RepID=A0A507QW02_MONPU|nr:hypothetical protein MPDQ_007603 [Monascus purpureus]
MDKGAHIIDPEGEVIIRLLNANEPFAAWSEEEDIEVVTSHHDDALEPVKEVNPEPSPRPFKSSRKLKKGKKKKASSRPLFKSPAEPPSLAEVPAEETVPIADLASDGAVIEPSPAPENEPTVDLQSPTAEPVEEGVEETNEAIESSKYDGDLQNKEYTIQVSAKHLAFASPVFKTILASGWKEGNHLLSEGSVEIVVESWDIDALLILLNIIHCRHRNLPRKISLELLAKIFVLADYYMCVEAVEYFAGHWISNLEEKIPASYSRDLFLWIWISWIFERSADFKCASSVAMRQATGLIHCNLGLPIPDPIIQEMNQKRLSAICIIVDALHGQHDQLTRSDGDNCFDCSSIKLGALTKEMYANSLLPKPTAPFAGISFDRLQTTA